MRKRVTIVVPVVLFLLAVSSCRPYVADSKDRAEAREVHKYLLEHHEFTADSKMNPGHPAVFATPGRDFVYVTIYEVTSSEEQETVLALLREGRRKHPWRALCVEFYREEVVHKKGPVMERGEQELLREVTLVDE
jgi:hypothetical protein